MVRLRARDRLAPGSLGVALRKRQHARELLAGEYLLDLSTERHERGLLLVVVVVPVVDLGDASLAVVQHAADDEAGGLATLRHERGSRAPQVVRAEVLELRRLSNASGRVLNA